MKRKDILQLIKDEPYKLGHFIGFDKLTELHNKWLKLFLFSNEDITLLGHRGSYKTTVISIFLAIHLIIKPRERVIFFRKTDNDVQEIMRQVAKILKTGCFQRIVKEIYGVELQFIKETSSEIHTNLCTDHGGQSQILALGIGTSITGKHADIVITDDIVNVNDRISRAEREKTKIAYQELQNVKNRGGRFINTGTPWHKDDAISQLMPNKIKYTCYDTGLMTPAEIKDQQEKMTPSLFAANYELKHIADKDALFKNPKYLTANQTQLIYNGIAHLDAAYDGEDFTAFTIAKEEDGLIIVYGKLWQSHVIQHLAEIEELKAKYRAGTLWMEKNADKGFLASTFEERGNFVETYHESTNKYIKIATYLKANWNRVYFLPETDPEYIDQILDYTEQAEHDDAPDSLSSIIRIITGDAQIQFYSGDYL